MHYLMNNNGAGWSCSENQLVKGIIYLTYRYISLWCKAKSCWKIYWSFSSPGRHRCLRAVKKKKNQSNFVVAVVTACRPEDERPRAYAIFYRTRPTRIFASPPPARNIFGSRRSLRIPRAIRLARALGTTAGPPRAIACSRTFFMYAYNNTYI